MVVVLTESLIGESFPLFAFVALCADNSPATVLSSSMSLSQDANLSWSSSSCTKTSRGVK